jgi:hypothetical protein
MKSVEQNCEEHVQHKPEFDVFSVTVACKLYNLAVLTELYSIWWFFWCAQVN